LTDEGYECFRASNVEAAVEMIQITPGIALILSDLNMPGKTGIDLVEIVKTKLGKNIEFIFMSGHASLSVMKSDVNISSYAFLKKPLNIEKLTTVVAAVLAKNGSQF